MSEHRRQLVLRLEATLHPAAAFNANVLERSVQALSVMAPASCNALACLRAFSLSKPETPQLDR
ncbi:MAG: hypothetical protein OXB95_07385 [Rhodobacteraceae bacterium]|nr:hypothetical protein [Paracoccaceae bacterium]